MKVIDLLNKIANGEARPDYIEFINDFTKETENMFVCSENIFYYLDNGDLKLNTVVSALEEKEEYKEIEKLDVKNKYYADYTKTLCEKIDEIIDVVNELKKGK